MYFKAIFKDFFNNTEQTNIWDRSQYCKTICNGVEQDVRSMVIKSLTFSESLVIFSLHWPTWLIQSLCRNVRLLCDVVQLHEIFSEGLLTLKFFFYIYIRTISSVVHTFPQSLLKHDTHIPRDSLLSKLTEITTE